MEKLSAGLWNAAAEFYCYLVMSKFFNTNLEKWSLLFLEHVQLSKMSSDVVASRFLSRLKTKSTKQYMNMIEMLCYRPVSELNWPLVFWRHPPQSCHGGGSDSLEGWSEACETLPASLFLTDSSGCHHQTAEHPGETKGKGREWGEADGSGKDVDAAMKHKVEKKQFVVVLMAPLEQT